MQSQKQKTLMKNSNPNASLKHVDFLSHPILSHVRD